LFKKSAKYLFVLSTICTQVAAAQTSGVSLSSTKSQFSKENQLQTKIEAKEDKKKEKGLRSEFIFRSNELVENVGEQVGNRFFGDYNIDYDAGGGADLIKKFSLRSRVNNEEQLMFSIPESYLKYEFGDSQLVFGRQILNWSSMDANWGFGKLNNRVNFDYFEPGQEGLTGILYSTKLTKNLTVELFGSTLYVPEMNPGQKYDKENGQVSCQNMWCKPLANTAPVGDKDVPIFYNVNMPEVNDVVFRYTVGGRIVLDLDPVEIDFFAIRKPENTVSVTAEIQYQNDENRIFVDVTPQFYYHDVKGGSVKIKPTDNFTVYGGGISILPNSFPDGSEPYIEYTGIKPQKISEDYLGGGLLYSNDNYVAGIHYIARVSEYDIDSDNLLVDYPRWNQAYHINLQARLSRKLSMGLDYKYDMLTEDRLTMLNANYNVSRNVTTSMGMNIIGANEDTNSFWTDYSNNDSVYAQMKYRF
jgi:hypothetical protein